MTNVSQYQLNIVKFLLIKLLVEFAMMDLSMIMVFAKFKTVKIINWDFNSAVHVYQDFI